MPENNPTKLARYVSFALNGSAGDVDRILVDLNDKTTLVDTRFIDFALSLVTAAEGVERIKLYLFEGTQIQRNYCTLFFNRRCEKGDWDLVKKAFKLGLIDEKQAFSK